MYKQPSPLVNLLFAVLIIRGKQLCLISPFAIYSPDYSRFRLKLHQFVRIFHEIRIFRPHFNYEIFSSRKTLVNIGHFIQLNTFNNLRNYLGANIT